MTTPAKPASFNPETPPPGFESKLISFWRDRPFITPRLQLVHTNGASREGSIEASYNWANQPGSGNTIPHCQIDRDGRGAMMLPSNRKGIANYRAAGFSLGFETADTGYLADPAMSAFTDKQAESVAVCLAYYAWGHKIALHYPSAWDGAGSACHSEPFAYPYWTNSNGKICPGLKKKAQMRDLVLPRAREILSAWLDPTPTPTPTPAPSPPGDTSLWVTPPGNPSISVGATDASTIISGWPSGRVSWLQGIIGTPMTGTYLAADKAKMVELQRIAGITADGVYGSQTAAVFLGWRGR